MNVTAKEIMSQPDVWLRGLEHTDLARAALARPGKRVRVIGCGTSAFIAGSLAHLREQAGLGETDAGYASEPIPPRPYDAVIAITRSGTTTEVLDALAALPEGTTTVAVTAVPDSPVARVADETLLLDFADEASVVQTRFPTTALIMARAAFGESVGHLPAMAAEALDSGPPETPEDFDHIVYLATGWAYGLAQEAALKIREAARMWAESYPLLDYRHGPLAVAHPGSLVWLLGSRDEALARDIAVTGATVVQRAAADPLIELALAQQVAVREALARGLDPDNPMFLTRSVVLT